MTPSVIERLEITTCGGLQVTQAGAAALAGVSRKATALFVYLACARGPQSRERLAELLWDDRSPAQSASNLRTVLTLLRPHVGPYLLLTHGTIALAPTAPLWLDYTELDRRLALARALARHAPKPAPEEIAALEEAVALYGGPFLQGFYLRDASGFEEWMLREQTRLEQAIIEALQRLLRDHEQNGDPFTAIRHARRLLELDPLHEATQRRLISLLARAGQRAGALAQYDQCVRVLDAELGSAPEAATTDLAVQIRSGAWQPPLKPPAGPPAAPLLLRGLAGADPNRRGQIYSALVQLRAAALPLDTTPLGALLLDEIRAAYEAVVVYADLLPSGPDALLRETLDRAWGRGLERIGLLLDVLYPGGAGGGLRRPLPGSGPSPPAPAAAHLPPQLDPPLADLLRTLLAGSAAAIVAGAADHFGLVPAGLVARLAQLADDADPWLRACALFRIGELGLTALRDLAQTACGSADALVRETAGHTVQALQEAG